MQAINLLSRLFDEELSLMSSHFFNPTTYKTYLKPCNSSLSTHYTITLKKEESGVIRVVSHLETPFHHKSIEPYQSNYINLLKDNTHKSILDYLIGEFKASKIIFKYIFIKYCKTNRNLKAGQDIEVELFASLSLDAISEETMAYYYYCKLMEQIRKAVLLEIQNVYFDPQKTEKKRTILIRKYQNKISYYLSELERNFSEIYMHSCIEYTAINKTLADSFRCIHLNLEKILSYIEHCLYDYMDKEQPISYLQRKHFIKKQYNDAETLISFIKIREFTKDIEIAICKPLVAIVENKLKDFTYERRDYCCIYISVFKALLKKKRPFDNYDIYKLLISLDYNNYIIFKALERQFLIELDNNTSLKEKQNYLYIKLANINKIVVITPYKYYSSLPGLKAHLIAFIKEMLNLHEEQEKLAVLMGIKNTTVNTHDEKRKISISVQELSLFSRLFFESGITQLGSSKHQYFKFIASNYTSKDGEHFSEHNIKNAFYSPKYNSFESVEKLLIVMLSKLQKLKNSNVLKNTY